jgi:hypothetical protein
VVAVSRQHDTVGYRHRDVALDLTVADLRPCPREGVTEGAERPEANTPDNPISVAVGAYSHYDG